MRYVQGADPGDWIAPDLDELCAAAGTLAALTAVGWSPGAVAALTQPERAALATAVQEAGQ